MTDTRALQQLLADTGRYLGRLDGIAGRLTREAVMEALRDGPDTALVAADYSAAALRLRVTVPNIMAFAEVEAGGVGFEAGLPNILFEPHRFHRATKGVHADAHPELSYAKWGARPYPRRQAARYAQLLDAVALDVDAGFASASYGKFQILGENYRLCGFDHAHEFAFAMARDEATQLAAFCAFIEASGILPYLRASQWNEVARRYNGPAYRKNLYDVKLARVAGRITGELARRAA
jgi:hypothetical protein